MVSPRNDGDQRFRGAFPLGDVQHRSRAVIKLSRAAGPKMAAAQSPLVLEIAYRQLCLHQPPAQAHGVQRAEHPVLARLSARCARIAADAINRCDALLPRNLFVRRHLIGVNGGSIPASVSPAVARIRCTMAFFPRPYSSMFLEMAPACLF